MSGPFTCSVLPRRIRRMMGMVSMGICRRNSFVERPRPSSWYRLRSLHRLTRQPVQPPREIGIARITDVSGVVQRDPQVVQPNSIVSSPRGTCRRDQGGRVSSGAVVGLDPAPM